MASAYHIYQNFDFSGGLNTREKVAQISSNECTLSQNWLSNGKAIEVLPGYRKFNTTPIPGMEQQPVRSMFRFIKPIDPNIKRFLIQCGTAVFVADEVNKTWTQLIGSLDPYACIDWAVYGDVHCYLINDVDGLYKYNGTSIYTLPAAPKGATVSTHFNRLFVGGGRQHPSRLYWTEAGQPDSWDTIQNFQELPSVNGDGITKLIFFLDSTLVFKHQSIWQVAGNIDPFPINVVSDSIGCPAPKSVVVYGDRIFWFSNTKHIYCFDRLRLINLTLDRIGPLPVCRDKMDSVCCQIIDNRLWVSYCDEDSHEMYNDRVMICDIEDLAQPKWFGPHRGFRIVSFCSFDGHNDSGQVYFGDANTATVWRKSTDYFFGSGLEGTATAGTAQTISIKTDGPVEQDELAGCSIELTGGTGSGQSRIITANTACIEDSGFYTGTITVDLVWDTIPSTDTVWEVGAIEAKYRTGVLSMDAPERQKIFDKVFVHTESEGSYPLTIEIVKNHLDTGNQYDYSMLGSTSIWDSAAFDESDFATPDMLDNYIDLDFEEAKYLTLDFTVRGRDHPALLYGYILVLRYGDMLNFHGK